MAKSNVHASKRVLCWRPKDQGSNVAHKQATSMLGEPIPQNSNSNPPLGLPTSSNDQSPAHAPEITAINCSKCLGFGHTRKAYTNYGHKSAACLSEARNHHRYRPIPVLEDEGAGGVPLYQSVSTPFDASAHVLPPSTPLPSTVQKPNPSAPMVNWVVDPHPHVPQGFMLVEPVQRPPLRHEVFVYGCYTLYNKDLVIVKLQPSIQG